MQVAKLGLAMALGVALAACSGEKDAGEGDARKDHASAPAKAAKQAKPEPAAPAREAEVADATTEPERRFDMTKDGEAQTADNFEAWMDEQGIRVADGEQAGATSEAAPEDADASQGSGTSPVETEDARR